MRKGFMVLAAAVFLTGVQSLSAGPQGNADSEKIQIQLEYHKRMVGIIENYLRDRAKIPADYQAVADKEFIRRANAEKPLSSLADAKPPRGVSAADQPQETAKTAKPAAKPASSSKPPRY